MVMRVAFMMVVSMVMIMRMMVTRLMGMTMRMMVTRLMGMIMFMVMMSFFSGYNPMIRNHPINRPSLFIHYIKLDCMHGTPYNRADFIT